MSCPKTEPPRTVTETGTDFQPILLSYFTLIDADEVSDSRRTLRITAMKELQRNLQRYQQRGYMQKLLCAIAEKKGKQILQITTKKELKELGKSCCPHFNGRQFVPNESSIPEEELIYWSEVSLKAPLNEIGFKRYMEVFRQVFPEESRMLPV